MFIVNEDEREYSFGESGPKYLMKGPRMNFALVRIRPGESFQAHYHTMMEEDFFITEGRVDILVDGVRYTLGVGSLLHVEPTEIHYVVNPYDQPAKMAAILGPSQLGMEDKVIVPNPA